MRWIPVILVLPYFFMLLRIWINLKKIKQYDLNSGESVFVSIVVPFRNEESHLPFILEDLARQEYPSDLFEVLVVDDNSTDASWGIAESFRGIRNLSLIKNSGTGKKSAIRTGISMSSANLIITTDADCRMNSGWLKTICLFFTEHKPDMMICPVQLENRSDLFGRFQELEFLSLQGITAGSAVSENATMCNGANLAFKRGAYLKHAHNLHDEIASGDDIFFLQSLKKEPRSKIMWLESMEAIVTAASSKSIKEYLKQRQRWLLKVRAYRDIYTILLGSVTFVTNFLILSLLFASLINPAYLKILIASFLAKSIPDFLILRNTSGRYKRRSLMKWFLPAEIIYPFYILGVTIFSMFTSDNQKINSPFRKET